MPAGCWMSYCAVLCAAPILGRALLGVGGREVVLRGGAETWLPHCEDVDPGLGPVGTGS